MPIERCAIYDPPAILRALETDGCALVPNALPAETCVAARRKIDALTPVHWDEVHLDDQSHARFLDRYLCVFNRDAYWLQFLDRPGIIDVADATLGADCHVIGQTAWRSHPGFAGEPFHADYLPPLRSLALPVDWAAAIFIITVHFYLCDVTRELAPTRLIPGSHRAGRAPYPGESAWSGRPAELVLANAGDALLFRSDLWHAGTDNVTSKDVRYLLQVHYGRREMAQHFSPFMDWRFASHVMAMASKRQRRLLGDHDPGAYD